jgi:hypothetical protein
MFGSRTLGGTANATQMAQGNNIGVGNGGGVESAQQGAGAVSGDERFLRENRQPGAFVGADTADAINLRSQAAGANAQQGLRNLQGLFQQLGRGNEFNGQGNGQQGSRTQIRVPLRLGFQPRPVAAPQFTAKFEARLTKLPGLQTPEPIQVVMQGRTAILRGKVASESDRALAEGLARLEPEVLDVQNELVVDPAATTAEELPQAAADSLP